MVGGCGNCGAHQDPCQNTKGTDPCCPSPKEDICSRLKTAQISSKVLESILDIASTLVSIMQICGIHECKANRALDVIIYAFMHFDEVANYPGGKCKKRIRKDEFSNDLTRDCGMNKADTKLTYAIVKYAFKAFYHKQPLTSYNTAFVDECSWRNAANKTVTAFAQSGASKSQIESTGRRILSVYENFISRLQAKCPAQDKQKYSPCVCSSGRPAIKEPHPCEHALGQCKTRYLQRCPFPDPPLCAQLQCQFVCSPGSTFPQIICKDPCGRLFLKVNGECLCFDPLILECEARRAAMDVCPPNTADRLKALKECLKPCMPKDTDSCDEKLAEINEEDGKDIDQFRPLVKESKLKSELKGEVDSKGSTFFEDGASARTEGEPLKDESLQYNDYKEQEEEEAGGGFFISAEFRNLENAKRRLDVKIKGICRRSEKQIKLLSRLHVENNRREEIWYELTPINIPEIVQKPSQVPQSMQQKQSQAISEKKSSVTDKPSVNMSAGEPAADQKSQIADENKWDIGGPNNQDSGDPAPGPASGDKSDVEPAGGNPVVQ